MARKASSKSDFGSSCTATIGFEADSFVIQTSTSRVPVPASHFDSTQVSFCPWFLGKSEAAGKSRAASELELALAA